MEQFCKQHHFSKQQLQKCEPLINFVLHLIHSFGVWEEVLEAVLALLLLDIDCGNAAQRESVFCHRGLLKMHESAPPMQKSVFS